MAGRFQKLAGDVLSVLGWPLRLAFVERILHGISRRTLRYAIPIASRLTKSRLAKSRPRSFWGVTPIITLPLKTRADEKLGIRSESVVWETYVITRNFSWNLRILASIVQRLNPNLHPAFCRIVLAVALLRYDIFHYFNDRGLLAATRHLGLEPEELNALKLAGKSTYVFVYGADIRTREATLALGRWNFCSDCPEPRRYCICDDERGQAQLAETASRVNAIISMGDMIAYTPEARNVHYWPIDIDRIPRSPPGGPKIGPLTVAHAPNHMHFKGTRYLEDAIRQLQSEGHEIVLSKISGVPNTEVMRLFVDADIVADQFIGGAHGYTALEAMAHSKPVLCYIRNLEMVVGADDCPLIQANPDTIVRVLRWCLENRDLLPAIGAQGREYVEKHHTIDAVAARLAAIYGETAVFPDSLVAKWQSFITSEQERQAGVSSRNDWHHPFRIKP